MFVQARSSKDSGSRQPAPLVSRVGTAGWSIPSRYAADFPDVGSHLARYAARLHAVEINSSFYRPHRRSTYERWAVSVPADFQFSAKIPKVLTHDRRLADCADGLDGFIADASGLGEKLAVLLVQLPPSLPFDVAVVDRFLSDLTRRTSASIACEPRHASWFDPSVEAVLKAHHVARVAADPAPAPGGEAPGGWGGLIYRRMHGSPRIYFSDYDETVLARLRSESVETSEQGTPSWCIFDNTAASHALGNALVVADR